MIHNLQFLKYLSLSSVDVVQKRWNDTCDGGTRLQRKYKEASRSGSAASSSSASHLSFVKKSQTINSTESSYNLMNSDQVYTNPPPVAASTPASSCSEKSHPNDRQQLKRKKTEDPLEKQMLLTLEKLSENQNKKTNRYLSFFKGILPSIECFNEMATLQLQAGVVQLVKNIRIEKGYDPQTTRRGAYHTQPLML